MDDPFHWTLDRVVQEFCTSNRSWKPIVNPPRLPKSTQLEEALRENEVEGWVLLSSDPKDLCSMLSIRSAGQVITIVRAVEHLRKRSKAYKESLEDETPSENQGNLDIEAISAVSQIDKRNPGPTEAELQESKDRLRKFLQKSSVAPTVTRNHGAPTRPLTAPAQSPEQEHPKSAAPQPEIAPPPPKKRRLALNSLETKALDPDAHRSNKPIPTAADIVPSLRPLVSAAVHVPAGAYLPPQGISRLDFINGSFIPQGVEAHDLKDGFVFVRQTTIPLGRQRQAYHNHRKLFSARMTSASSNRGSSDLVAGASDPEHDEVLPIYGESDEEDGLDEQTWTEIEEEKSDRENRAREEAQAAASILSKEEVASALEDLTESIIQTWQERKLIPLQRGAYKQWRESRGAGLHWRIRKVERVLRELEARLSKYKDNILKQQWKSWESIQGMRANLDATISDIETTRWELQLLRSPVAPEKTPSLPQLRRPRPIPIPTPQPLGEDEEEIVTSEDEDYLDDFIVDNGADMDVTGDDHDTGINGDNDVSMDIDSESDQQEEGEEEGALTQDLADHSMDDHGSAVVDLLQPTIEETASRHEPAMPLEANISSVSTAPALLGPPPTSQPLRTPSSSRFYDGEIIDLTQSPAARSGHTTPSRSQTRADINAKPSKRSQPAKPKIKEEPEPTSSSSSRSFPSSTPAQAGGRESYLEFDIDDLSFVCQKIAHTIDAERDEIINFIFTIVKMAGENLWGDIIGPRFINFGYPSSKESGQLDVKVAYRFVLMLQTWDGQESMSRSQLKRASRDTRKELFAHVNDESPQDFIEFLSERLSDRFVWTKSDAAKAIVESLQQSNETDQSDINAEYGASDNEAKPDSQPTPRKKKRLTALDKQARELRRNDVARTVEQEARRKALRAKLQAYGDVSDAHFIINESKDEEDGFVLVHQDIAKRIKAHQVDGVRFMWNLIVPKRGVRQGCLLAHSMGLGKTMQIITLLVALTDAASSPDETVRRQVPKQLQENRFLILCPPALINNWHDEFLCWVPDHHNLGQLYKVDSDLSVSERLNRIHSWSENGGVLLLSYSLFRDLFDDKDLQRIFKERPNLVVADEAHMFKNPKSKLHIAAAEFLTQSRIAMTGSPLANNVEEYHSMINWIAPNYLSDIKAFRSHFAKPIHDGLQITSSSYERRRAMQRLHFLKKEVAPKVDRKTIAVLRGSIPKKTEFVLVMPLTKLQWKAYALIIQHQQGLDFGADRNASTTVFATLGVLGLLCAHPACFKHRLGKQGKISTAKQKSTVAEFAEAAQSDEADMTEDQACANLDPQLVAQQQFLVRDVEKMREDIDPLSWKVKMFMTIVAECQKCGDSVLVFSQSLGTLDYLGKKLMLAKIPYERLDGSTKMGLRQGMIKKFNDSTTSRVFLISTTAGGLGLNITGANRVIIFDFKFNPQHEQQAIGRAYRIGQTKPVYVYRLICGGTFEEMLLDRIVFKMQLAERVVDKKNPIPKAQQFAEFLKMPTDPPEKDLTKYKGQDNVLDAVLKSDARRGLRSILTMDTFEEEELDTYEVTEADRVEMEALIRPGASILPSRVGLGTPYPQGGFVAESQPIGVQTLPALLSHGSAPPIPSILPESAPSELNGHHAQASASSAVPLAPIAGASTSFRLPNSADYRPSQLRSNRAEFKRLFLQTEPGLRPLTEGEKSQRTQSAYKLAQLLTEKEPVLSKSIKNAILKAAESPSFGRAVSTGSLPPEYLVNMAPSAIELWQDMLSAKSLPQDQTPQPPIAQSDSDHLHDRVRRMSSISDGNGAAHKPHHLGDRAAMEAVLARRADRAPQQSNGPPFVRLPSWANNLIREGSSRQSSLLPPSPSPAADHTNQPYPSQPPSSSSPTIHKSPRRTKSRPKNPFLSD